MIKELNFRISPEYIHNTNYIHSVVLRELNLRMEDVEHIEILKRSIDARKKAIKYNLRVAVYIDEKFVEQEDLFKAQNVQEKPKVHIIGSGPAGLFAGLRALEIGLKPIIFERGKDVRARRRDLAKIHKEHIVDSDSNYCFGEGGAGTYSDGKLYTRSKKRGSVKTVLEWLVHFGADKDILVDAHPHIGTNRLPKIIAAIREKIIEEGGEVHFESKLTDIQVEENKISAIKINGETEELMELQTEVTDKINELKVKAGIKTGISSIDNKYKDVKPGELRIASYKETLPEVKGVDSGQEESKGDLVHRNKVNRMRLEQLELSQAKHLSEIRKKMGLAQA